LHPRHPYAFPLTITVAHAGPHTHAYPDARTDAGTYSFADDRAAPDLHFAHAVAHPGTDTDSDA
jgi:hypothetical protein